jgi:hypothetical protein
MFLILRVITAIYGITLILKFAGKAVVLYARGAGQ